VETHGKTSREFARGFFALMIETGKDRLNTSDEYVVSLVLVRHFAVTCRPTEKVPQFVPMKVLSPQRSPPVARLAIPSPLPPASRLAAQRVSVRLDGVVFSAQRLKIRACVLVAVFGERHDVIDSCGEPPAVGPFADRRAA